MEKLISKLCFAILFIILTSGFIIHDVSAQSVNISGPTPTPPNVPGIIVPNPYTGDRTIYPGNEQVNVSARVGEFVVNISGLSSPNASIVLEDGSGTFLRSTVADSGGYFYITGLNVRRGDSNFCFESIDFERIGNSEACIEVEPIFTSRDIEDVFLPPTIGLFAKQINAGSQALIYGYSMPNAAVTVRIQDGLTFNITAEPSGYYEYRYEEVPAGRYFLNSVAELESLDSLEPLGGVELEALSLPEQITTTTGEVVEKTVETVETVGDLLTNTLLGFLILMMFLILIIIIILIIIFKPAWMRAILNKFKNYRLHHDWLLEFIEINSS